MRITNYLPQDNAVDVSVDTLIKVQFDVEPDLDTLLSTMYSLQTEDGQTIDLNVSKDTEDPTVIWFAPQQQLSTATKYIFTLSNMDILSGTYFRGVDDTPLQEGITIRFTTVAIMPSSDVEVDLDAYYSTQFDIKEPPKVVGVEPASMLLKPGQAIRFVYNDEVDSLNGDIVYEITDVAGNYTSDTAQPQIMGNSIVIQINVDVNSILAVMIPCVKLRNKGTVEAQTYIFVTTISPSLVNLQMVEYRLGDLKEHLREIDIYLAMLDAYIELEGILRQPILGSETINFGNYISAVRKFLQAATLANLLKILVAKKVAFGGDSLATGGTNYTIGQIRGATLDFLEGEKKAALDMLQPYLDSLYPALDTVSRGARLLKEQLYFTFKKYRWDKGYFGKQPKMDLVN